MKEMQFRTLVQPMQCDHLGRREETVTSGAELTVAMPMVGYDETLTNVVRLNVAAQTVDEMVRGVEQSEVDCREAAASTAVYQSDATMSCVVLILDADEE